jgi:hypothetical protein
VIVAAVNAGVVEIVIINDVAVVVIVVAVIIAVVINNASIGRNTFMPYY